MLHQLGALVPGAGRARAKIAPESLFGRYGSLRAYANSVTAKSTKGFCFLSKAMRFRKVRCGFLEAVRQEYLEKEFSIRSIPLVKSPGNWRENDEPRV